MKVLGYIWAFPVTVVGLIIALVTVLTGGRAEMRAGVVEVSGGILSRILRGGRIFPGGAAATLGHVILARDQDCLDRSRDHERFHVRQFERWGILLLPVYWLIAIWLRIRGYHPYLDHPMEPPVR